MVIPEYCDHTCNRSDQPRMAFAGVFEDGARRLDCRRAPNLCDWTTVMSFNLVMPQHSGAAGAATEW